MNEFRIIYGRGRFPIRQRREDGTWGCRGCGSAIPKGRLTWCSTACKKRFEPSFVISAVRHRDNGICQRCGFDCAGALKDWQREYWKKQSWTERQEMRLNKPPAAEYDHIVPFSEGGLTVLENMRTLCGSCHHAVTKEWRQRKRLPAASERCAG